MGIINLTHTESGEPIQRLPVAIKLAIGLGPNEKEGRKAPKKLDHFVLLRKTTRGADIVWEPDPELASLYGEKPTEIGIILLDDEPENIFKTALAWWSSTECKCRGELVQVSNGVAPKYAMRATRRTERHPEGEEWPGPYKYSSGEKKGQPVEPCGDGCPDYERGDCKVSGDLYFILDKMPMLGAICRIHTTSYRSVRQIHAGLQQIRSVTGGRLAGIRAMLKVRPEKVTYERDGKKHTSTAHILSLEITAQDMEKLLSNMTETAKLFEQTRKLLGGRRVQVVEDDTERAPEIAAEFHPAEDDERPALPARASIPTPEEVAQQARVRELSEKLGHTRAQTDMLLGQHAGKLAALIANLEQELHEAATSAHTEAAPTEAACEAACDTPSNPERRPARTRPGTPPLSSSTAKARSFDF